MEQSLESLQKALAVDYVLTTTQIQRYYDLSSLESAKLKVFRHYVSATRHSRKHKEVNFVVLKNNRKARKERASTLRHYAGIADMRQQLNVPTNKWSLISKRMRRRGEEPDAFWYKDTTQEEASNKRTIAIEFDAGSYSSKQIKQKIMSFAVYQRQIWGSSSRKRVERINKLAKELNVPNFEVLEVSWL